MGDLPEHTHPHDELRELIDKLTERVEALEERREQRSHHKVAARRARVLDFLAGETNWLPSQSIALAIEELPDRVADDLRALERNGQVVRAENIRTPLYRRVN